LGQGEIFGKTPSKAINPDEAVAPMGAAIQGKFTIRIRARGDLWQDAQQSRHPDRASYQLTLRNSSWKDALQTVFRSVSDSQCFGSALVSELDPAFYLDADPDLDVQ
jgi:hypothetical protein